MSIVRFSSIFSLFVHVALYSYSIIKYRVAIKSKPTSLNAADRFPRGNLNISQGSVATRLIFFSEFTFESTVERISQQLMHYVTKTWWLTFRTTLYNWRIIVGIIIIVR